MSWYVQGLLRNRVKIKTSPDLESDEYNDLLVIERKINELLGQGIVSPKELKIIEYVSDGKPLVNSKENLGTNRISVSKNFSNICTKVAYYAGGYFTDQGYLAYMRNKFNLSEEDVIKMEKYMVSKYKNKLIRKYQKPNE